jgi:hypothetical protein
VNTRTADGTVLLAPHWASEQYRVLDRARLRAGFAPASADRGFLREGEVVESLEGR